MQANALYRKFQGSFLAVAVELMSCEYFRTMEQR
jgi:hypothetical protein